MAGQPLSITTEYEAHVVRLACRTHGVDLRVPLDDPAFTSRVGDFLEEHATCLTALRVPD